MIRAVTSLLLCAVIAGCTRSNMDSQPRYHEYEPGGLFRDGKVLQTPVPGTVARGDLQREAETKQRPKLTAEVLRRGREQYNIFCTPCHDRVGTGNGIVVQRGMPRPASFHDERQRALTDRHLFDVISDGFGVMYAHGDRIQPRDRWTIVAYIRALQLSQHAELSDLPPNIQAKMIIEKPP
jgi:cytochrome c553